MVAVHLHTPGLQRFLEAFAIHVRQVAGGVGEEPASLGEMGIQPVAGGVLVLAAQARRIAALVLGDLVVAGAVAPVERDEHAVGRQLAGGVFAALIEVGVRVVFDRRHLAVIPIAGLGLGRLCFGILDPILPGAQIDTAQALVQGSAFSAGAPTDPYPCWHSRKTEPEVQVSGPIAKVRHVDVPDLALLLGMQVEERCRIGIRGLCIAVAFERLPALPLAHLRMPL